MFSARRGARSLPGLVAVTPGAAWLAGCGRLAGRGLAAGPGLLLGDVLAAGLGMVSTVPGRIVFGSGPTACQLASYRASQPPGSASRAAMPDNVSPGAMV